MADYQPDGEQKISLDTGALGIASDSILAAKKDFTQYYNDACEIWEALISCWEGEVSVDYQLADITTRSMISNMNTYLGNISHVLVDYSAEGQKINKDAKLMALCDNGIYNKAMSEIKSE